MKRMLFVAVAFVMSLPLGLSGQGASDQLKDFTRILKGGDGLQLSLVHLNDKTVPIMFQPPTLYSMRVRARMNTLLYVQGTPQKEVELDTSNFTIQQGNETVAAKAVNIKHFEKGKVAKGDRIDGVLEFEKLIDVSKPFTVKHGADSVEFKFTDDQLKAMAPPPASPAP